MELQKEMLQLDLIDAEGGTQEEGGEDEEEEEEEEEERPLLLIDEHREEERSLMAAMDTYRPKRPTTLNLFPQVPRTQVSRVTAEDRECWCVRSLGSGMCMCVYVSVM